MLKVAYAGMNLSGLRSCSSFGFDLYSAGALLPVPVSATSFLLQNTFVLRSDFADAIN
jgi:hypothetical protein